MKWIILLFVLLLSLPLLPQSESAPPVELYFRTESAPSSPIITLILTGQSQRWSDESGNSCLTTFPGDYFLTNEYSNPVYVPESNNMGQYSAGFDFVTSQTIVGGNNVYPVFAYGLYKVTSNSTNKYFYLDYRDYRIGYYVCYNPTSYGHDIDLWIKYNYNSNTFEYSSNGGAIAYTEIENGQLLNLWDIKQKGTQLTSLFPDYWENALAVINNGNGKPKIIWGPYQESSGEYLAYYIYRASSSTSTPPDLGSFSYIASVSGDTYEFVDDYYLIGGNFYIHYYVKAYFIPTESFSSSGTNIASTSASVSYKINVDQNHKIYAYELNQNYPNPFNPLTNIAYNIAEDAQVLIKIYDMLGTEVAELVNETKPAGFYKTTFDAFNLSSGIYIYRITALNGERILFSQSKQMILIK